MKNRYLITSALLYANGKLHFGHLAGAYLPGDAFARFQRLQGSDVLFLSGSDEYGIAITLAAELEGRTPKEQVDTYDAINRALFEKMQVSFDFYARTTWPGHIAPVQKFFTDLYEKGLIEERVTDQLFSESEQKFLADRYVVGTCPSCNYEKARGDECPRCGASFEASQLIAPRSKLSGSPLIKKPTKHWFLLLDLFKEKLEKWLETKEWKPNVVNFIKGYIKELHPRAITRDMEWGVPIPLPGTEGKVLYVWFDAPIGYISAAIEWAEKKGAPDLWKEYWLKPETKLIHFIGKDNIPFHTAIFPAMCMGQSLPLKLVDEVPANEFYNLEGKKLSKSEGWYVDLEEFLESFTSDQLRYTILSNAPETSDSEFTFADFQTRCNSELLGKLGNLVNRTAVFAKKQCSGKVPPLSTLSSEQELFLSQIRMLTQEAREAFATFRLRRATQLLMEIAQKSNVFFDHQRPWQQAKENPEAMANTVRLCLEALRLLALVASPIIPASAEKIWKMIGEKGEVAKADWDSTLEGSLQEGAELPEPEVLFRRIEDAEIASWKEKLTNT